MRVITGAMFHIVTAIIIYLNFELCITHVVAVSDSLNENVTIAWNVGIENSSESTIPSTPHLQVVTTSRSFNTSTTTTEAPYLKTSSIERTVADVEKDRLPLTTEAFLPSNPVMTESSVTPSIASNTSQPQPDMAAFSTTSTAATTIMGVNTSVVEIAEPPVNIPEKSSGCTTSKPPDAINEIQRALDWLREKRVSDAWENDTHMVILAKELSNIQDRDLNENEGLQQIISDLEELLSVKQMEIDILTMLDRHRSATPTPIETDHLARYILALSALCKDPKRFYNHDLINLLQHHEPIADDEFALSTLAACSSSTHVRKRQIRRLLDIASGEISNIDTMALVLLALRCIITDHRHRHLQHFIRRPAIGLANLQGPRGSFGTLKSTALAMQALQDLPLDGTSYDRAVAVKWILDRQDADGSWKEEPLKDGEDHNYGVGLTADIIIALGCKGLGAIRTLQLKCDHVIRDSNGNGENGENGNEKIALPVGLMPAVNEETDMKNVSFSYTLWLESNISEVHSIHMVAQKNTSFFKAMTMAAEQEKVFAFEAREWPNGHYIHTLAGKKEEPTLYHYWLLYRLPELPDPESPPGNQLIAPVGVDELMVEDGEHYLYWYKKL